ncbi:AGAP002229-PA, partial [Gryllus bimaculatus]
SGTASPSHHVAAHAAHARRSVVSFPLPPPARAPTRPAAGARPRSASARATPAPAAAAALPARATRLRRRRPRAFLSRGLAARQQRDGDVGTARVERTLHAGGGEWRRAHVAHGAPRRHPAPLRHAAPPAPPPPPPQRRAGRQGRGGRGVHAAVLVARGRGRGRRGEQRAVVALPAGALWVALALQSQHHGHGALAPLAHVVGGVAHVLAPRPHHPPGAEGHQGAGRRLLHLRRAVGALLRAQPRAHGVRRGVRAAHRPPRLRLRHVARLRLLHGQPHLLHHLQQGVPPGLQEGAHVPIPQEGVAAAGV